MLQHAALAGLRREAGARLLPALARGVASWAKFNPTEMSGTKPAQVSNLVYGEWQQSEKEMVIPDPLNGEPFLHVPDTQLYEVEPFVASMRSIPKSGMHNPFKNPERYVMWGDITARAAAELRRPEASSRLFGWGRWRNVVAMAGSAGRLQGTAWEENLLAAAHLFALRLWLPADGAANRWRSALQKGC
jgi:hypothetical protein